MTTKNSTLVSNFEASPKVYNPAYQHHGRVRVAQGTIELATTDIDNNDVIMLVPLPVGVSITSIKLAADDLDSGGSPSLTFNVGLYQTDGTVKDEDCYASAITLGQAATAFTEYAFEARNINLCGQRVWEDAGDSSQPSDAQYYLAVTVQAAAATAAAGDMSFIVEYVVD
tara:strand:- start:836 stop:1345 length:510 start_codon:yes stop_codon:yes gene_type:complete